MISYVLTGVVSRPAKITNSEKVISQCPYTWLGKIRIKLSSYHPWIGEQPIINTNALKFVQGFYKDDEELRKGGLWQFIVLHQGYCVARPLNFVDLVFLLNGDFALLIL